MTKRSSLTLLIPAAGLLGGLLLGLRMWLLTDTGMPEAMTPAGSAAMAPVTLVAPQPAVGPTSAATPVIANPDAPVGRVPLDAALKAARQSGNYRQHIQQVLATPSASGIRVSLELHSACSVIQQTQRQAHAPKLQMASDLEAELQRRTRACEQGGGPDEQPFRALAAAKKRSFDNADEFMTLRPLKGTQEELAALYRLGDAGGMAGWGLASTPEHLLLMVGDETVFFEYPSRAPVLNAWQAAICERFSCDDFNARLVRCRDEASCQMTLQDIFKEASGLDDAAWQQALEAARRRVKALLPG